MITAVHTLVYADDAERARDFFRDVLGWPNVDAGGGWLIFRTGASELGVHPTDHGGGVAPPDLPDVRRHRGHRGRAARQGREFTQDVRDDGFGLTAIFVVPGGGEMMLYEPRHPTAYDME